MDKPRQHSRETLLAQAITALGQAEFPARLGDFLRHCCGFDNFIIIAYAGHGRPISLHEEATDLTVYQAFESEYATAAYILDPFYRLHLKRVPAGLYRLMDIAPDQFSRTRYYDQYYRETTLCDEIAVLAYTRSGLTITACVGKDHTSQSLFPRSAIGTLQRYTEVSVALIEQHWADLQPDWQAQPSQRPPALEQLIDQLGARDGVVLTRRQAQVALLILQGHSSKSIAAMLKISPQTVKVFRKQLYSRCGISSQAELFALLMPIVADITGGLSDGLGESQA